MDRADAYRILVGQYPAKPDFLKWLWPLQERFGVSHPFPASLLKGWNSVGLLRSGQSALIIKGKEKGFYVDEILEVWSGLMGPMPFMIGEFQLKEVHRIVIESIPSSGVKPHIYDKESASYDFITSLDLERICTSLGFGGPEIMYQYFLGGNNGKISGTYIRW